MLTQVFFDGLVADEGLGVGSAHDTGIAYAFFGLKEFSVVVYYEFFAVCAYEEVGVLLGHLVELYRVFLQYLVFL